MFILMPNFKLTNIIERSSMNRILFDLWQAQPLAGWKFHGGGEYIKSVFRYLLENFEDRTSVSVFYDPELYIDDWIKELLSLKKISIFHIKKESDIQNILEKKRFDVFYSGLPYAYGEMKIPPKTFFCGTIHGLRQIEKPSDLYSCKYRRTIKPLIAYFFQNFLKRKAINKYGRTIAKLDSIFCVSNHTKYAVKNFFPNLDKPIYTFYTPQKVAETCDLEHSGVSGKFILLISCNRFEKNSYRAIRALDGLFTKGLLQKYKVIAVGKLPKKIAGTINNSNRFINLDYVSTQKLEGLYADCDFFLYPTLNEGFGMPPLEAMKYGKTCVVSGVCSVPEICGDAVYYINPYDIQEMQTRILFAAENKIPTERIAERLRLISEKQNADLNALCKHLVGLSE